MAKYAANTRVPIERTKSEIERCLERYGADGFMSAWDRRTGREGVTFDYHGLRIAIEIDVAEKAQERRQRWRAMLLVIKAKLEAIESGISTFEDEFLAWVCDANGLTLGQVLKPKLEQIAETGRFPMLPAGGTEG